MHYKKTILLFLFATFCITSCKKYPEDSKSPHLETIKWRLAGGVINGAKSWNSTGRYDRINNQDLGPLWQSKTTAIRLARNEHFDEFVNPFVGYGYQGARWKLIGKKEAIRITTENGIISEYQIIKLDNDALWLQNDSLIYKFERHKNND